MSDTNRFSYSSFGSNEQSGAGSTDREELLRRVKAQEQAAVRQQAAKDVQTAQAEGDPAHEEALRRAQAQREAAQRRMQAQQRQSARPIQAQGAGTHRAATAARGTAQTVTFGEDDEQILRENRDRAREQAHKTRAAQRTGAGQVPSTDGGAQQIGGRRPLTAQEQAAAKAAAKERRAVNAAKAKRVPAGTAREQAGAKTRATGAKPAKTAGGSPPRGRDGKGKTKKSNKKAITIVVSIVAALLVVAGTLFALSYLGILNFQKEQFYTYEVGDSETLVKYLQHPSLKAGDTLNVTGACTVDVVESFGDVAVLPLVNFSGSGSVAFEGGTVLFAGDSKTANLSGLQFSNCEVYVEAGETNLTWDAPVSDDNINAATLNGAAHARQLSLLVVGSYATIPVTLENNGGALSNVEIKLTSASCIFPEGDTYIVEALGSGSSVIQVPVIITEGGRIQVSAFGTDAGGNTVVTGKSAYLRVAGSGYYAGDLHTHTTESVFDREGSLDSNIRYGYQNGLSFMFSVENRESPDEDDFDTRQEWAAESERLAKIAKENAAREEAEKEAEEEAGGETAETPTDPAAAGGSNFLQLSSETVRRQSLPVMLATTATTDNDTDSGDEDAEAEESVFEKYPGDDYIAEQLDQSAVDSITGAPGEFLQIAAVETGYKQQHMLIYGVNLAPPSDYGDQYHIADYIYATWTYQEALNAVLEGNGIVVLPHVISRDAEQGIKHAFSLEGMTAIEVVSIGQKVDETGGIIERNIWNCINTRGAQKLFAVMTSNNYTSAEVGTAFIKGRLDTLSEDAIYDLLRSGEFIASNGPEVRFTLGGHVMGGEIFLPQLAETDEGGEGGETAPSGTKAKARLYAADDAPLTEVKLLRYTVTNSIDNVVEEVVFSQTFTGDVYSFTTEVELELNPGEFYRVEVRSATNDLGNDVGLGLSNPIWVSDERLLQNSTTIQSIDLKGGAELMTAPNGALYIKADRFNAGMIDVLTDGKATSVTYHHYSSDLIADKVTVQITASDASQTTETIYLVK